MTNNDILRSLRYAFDFNDEMMMKLFKLGGFEAERHLVSDWMKKEDDESFKILSDKQLAIFLNGFIIEKRGKKEEGVPLAEERLNNNAILRKLKIALSLKDEDMLEILALENRKLSKHELSAFFRKPEQKQYKVCQNQILRNFLFGLQKKYRSN